MSSYGSLSPPDEGFDRHEHYYCTPHAYHGTSCAGAAEGAEGAWPPEGEHEPHDLFDTPHYIHRGYGYEEMQMSSESYDGYHPMHHIYPQSGAGLECEAQSTAPLRPYERATPPAFMRVVKRRNTANKKERRRTQSINTAFSDLRECIPNVPADTKLSKIKTLRLATSYISYLMRVLESDGEPAGGFCADLRHPAPRRRQHDATQSAPTSPEGKRAKGRTGWPQHVWALELNGDQGLQA